jgi:hypothetical protein
MMRAFPVAPEGTLTCRVWREKYSCYNMLEAENEPQLRLADCAIFTPSQQGTTMAVKTFNE